MDSVSRLRERSQDVIFHILKLGVHVLGLDHLCSAQHAQMLLVDMTASTSGTAGDINCLFVRWKMQQLEQFSWLNFASCSWVCGFTWTLSNNRLWKDFLNLGTRNKLLRMIKTTEVT